jgi:hypothetical protein
MSGQSASVRKHVTKGDRARHPGILHLESGIVLYNRIVPSHEAFADESGDHRGRNRLRHRGELKHGVGVDRFRLAHLANAVAAQKRYSIVVNDGDCQTWHTGSRHALADNCIELWENLGNVLSRHRLGEGQFRQKAGNHRGSRPKAQFRIFPQFECFIVCSSVGTCPAAPSGSLAANQLISYKIADIAPSSVNTSMTSAMLPIGVTLFT